MLRADGTLSSLSESQYDSEARLQELLARYPALLAGQQIDPESPRRWLLVTRELGVPDAAEAGDRWSLDHLFIDQDAIPTLVEVKRASDTRARREVVAQMLDYAANGISFWPVETIRARFEARCLSENKLADDEIRAFIGPLGQQDRFWQDVKTNLQAGRIRMLFVADEMPAELRRIVEFLNTQMDPAEVLAVEIRQYTGEGLKTLVPRVYGQSELATEKKAGGAGSRATPWDEASFFAKLAERGDPVEMTVARKLFDWCRQRFTRIDFGRGRKNASFIPVLVLGDGWFGPLLVYTGGRRASLEFPLAGSGMQMPPFNEPAKRVEYAQRLNRVPGITIVEDPTRMPNVPASQLGGADALNGLFAVVDWALREVRRANPH